MSHVPYAHLDRLLASARHVLPTSNHIWKAFTTHKSVRTAAELHSRSDQVFGTNALAGGIRLSKQTQGRRRCPLEWKKLDNRRTR